MRRAAWLRDLAPGYFALVMATEIVATACDLEGLKTTARGLVILGGAAFVVLAIFTLARALLFPGAFFGDFGDHDRGVGFFTLTAAIAVLAANLVTIPGFNLPSMALGVTSIALWALLTYGVFAALIMRKSKPSLETGMHGGWLLAVVATETNARLTLVLLPNFRAEYTAVLFFALALWLAGGMLYVWMISLIFYRYTFLIESPAELRPTTWIDMGSMASAAAVGALLTQRLPHSAFADLGAFAKGLTIVFWATGTWWTPMLAVLAVWLHVGERQRLRYTPLYWGTVFPLGMYAVATWRVAEMTNLGFLYAIPFCFTWIALAAWAITAVAMLMHIVRGSSRNSDIIA